MPNYDYECPVCNRVWTETGVPINARHSIMCGGSTEHPHLLTIAILRPAAPGIAFKGTGFYATDYKDKP